MSMLVVALPASQVSRSRVIPSYMYGINMDLEPLGYSNWQVRTIIQLNVQIPTSETHRACEDK